MTWVYIRSEPGLFTVGFYDPSGKWHADSDHQMQENAAKRVRWLHGGNDPQPKLTGGAGHGGTSEFRR